MLLLSEPKSADLASFVSAYGLSAATRRDFVSQISSTIDAKISARGERAE